MRTRDLSTELMDHKNQMINRATESKSVVVWELRPSTIHRRKYLRKKLVLCINQELSKIESESQRAVFQTLRAEFELCWVGYFLRLYSRFHLAKLLQNVYLVEGDCSWGGRSTIFGGKRGAWKLSCFPKEPILNKLFRIEAEILQRFPELTRCDALAAELRREEGKHE